MTGTRRSSRELALQVLFQQEFLQNDVKGDVEKGLATFRQCFSAPEDVWVYALELLKGVEQHFGEIDALIQKHSVNWQLKRMALVDLNIMRIATYELRFSRANVPTAVALNEAIEISKKFGSVDSASFVNGILDQIVKQ